MHLTTHFVLFISLLRIHRVKLCEASRASWDLLWRWSLGDGGLGVGGRLGTTVLFDTHTGCTLWPPSSTFQRYHCPFFLPVQHTRWDSSAHTVTQAFRHSLAPANTISVTFHYMVLGWISGLEPHQISTQGALPPHAQHCFSATMFELFSLCSFTNA